VHIDFTHMCEIIYTLMFFNPGLDRYDSCTQFSSVDIMVTDFMSFVSQLVIVHTNIIMDINPTNRIGYMSACDLFPNLMTCTTKAKHPLVPLRATGETGDTRGEPRGGFLRRRFRRSPPPPVAAVPPGGWGERGSMRGE
jgi:hypothetical protein